MQRYVMLLCALAVLFDGYDLQVLALTVPALSRAWSTAPSAFGMALSASLLGMGLGAAFIGPLGDRYGRRTLLVITLAIVGVSSIASALAQNITQMALCRFFTGAALGASLANAYVLTADFMPRRRRASLITMMYCNTATGALTAAVIAPWAIANHGWQAAFIIGGVLPLLLAVALLTTAPESIKFLLHRRPHSAGIAATLRKLAPGVDAATVYLRPVAQALGGTVRDLFTRAFRASTLLVWLAFVMNSFNLYLLVSWLPTLLTGAGWTSTQAIQAMIFNQVGGIIGGVSLGWLMDRFGAEKTLACAALLNAVTLALFLFVPAGFLSWGALLLVIGACTGGAQFAMVSLLAALYPSGILATGTGWALAIARVGAVASPLVGAALIKAGVPSIHVIAGLAAPAFICAVAMLALSRVRQRLASAFVAS